MPAQKLGIPLLFNLYANTQEDESVKKKLAEWLEGIKDKEKLRRSIAEAIGYLQQMQESVDSGHS